MVVGSGYAFLQNIYGQFLRYTRPVLVFLLHGDEQIKKINFAACEVL